MKNKLIIGMLSFVMTLSAVITPVGESISGIGGGKLISANAETSGDYEYEILNDGTVEITHYTGSATELTIPSTLGGKRVTKIGEGSFSWSDLESVTIPDSITTIENCAFYCCNWLISVMLPDGLTSIGNDAFEECQSLKKITIPKSVTNIGRFAFYGTPWLENKRNENPLVIVNGILIDGRNCSNDIIIPNTVTSIGDYAFWSCGDLTSITIPESVTSVGISAFEECTNLKTVIIPDNTINIGENAFNGTPYRGANDLEDDYNDIYDDDFNNSDPYIDFYYEVLDDGTIEITSIIYVVDEDDTGIDGNVTIPSVIDGKKVTSIGEEAFYKCDYIVSITIPNGVNIIGDHAFFGCPNLEKVTIPNSVTVIGDSSFMGCENLKTINIPNGITEIGAYAFCLCTNLKSITIPNGRIENNAFDYCENLTSVSLGNNVTYIGDDAFQICAFKSITIPNSVKDIGDGAFFGCSNLESVNISNSITQLRDYVFSGCENLKSIDIPNSVTRIGEGAFDSCYSLSSISLPIRVTDIGSNAFTWCNNLKSVNIPNNVISIGDEAFSFCNSLSILKIPSSVKSIGQGIGYRSNLFSIDIDSNNKNYTSINGILFNKNKTEIIEYPAGNENTSYAIPNGVQKIADSAFAFCKSIKSVTIPDSVTSIGNSAFSYCSNISSLKIPNSVVKIDAAAFNACINLTSVTIPDNGISIGEGVFLNCLKLKSIVIPKTTKIGNVALGYCNESLDNQGNPTGGGGIWYNEDFKINCYKGTAGEKYAKDNGFDYELVSDEPAHTHSYTSKVTKQPTCTETGVKTYTCECGDTYTETIPATGHKYTTSVVKPTCTEKGYTLHKCSTCGNEYKDTYTNATGHKFGAWTVTKKATCTTTGTQTRKCTVCGVTETKTIAKTAHTYKKHTTKATLTKNGSIVEKCSACGAKKSTTVIYYPKTIALAKTSYVYNGKIQKPAVTVKDSKGKVIAKSNYTVTYASGCKNVGKYAVKVTFKGNYSGTKTLAYTIIPKGTSISKLTAGKKSFTAKWVKNATQTTGYQIQYTTDSKFKSGVKTVTIKKNSTVSKTISKLTGGKKYYVRVRTYRTANKVNYFSAWSGAKAVTTKK